MQYITVPCEETVKIPSCERSTAPFDDSEPASILPDVDSHTILSETCLDLTYTPATDHATGPRPTDSHVVQDVDPGENRKKSCWAITKIACSTCRTRKLKCDGTKPVCKRCLKAGESCNYYSNSRRKPNKARGRMQQVSPLPHSAMPRQKACAPASTVIDFPSDHWQEVAPSIYMGHMQQVSPPPHSAMRREACAPAAVVTETGFTKPVSPGNCSSQLQQVSTVVNAGSCLNTQDAIADTIDTTRYPPPAAGKPEISQQGRTSVAQIKLPYNCFNNPNVVERMTVVGKTKVHRVAITFEQFLFLRAANTRFTETPQVGLPEDRNSEFWISCNYTASSSSCFVFLRMYEKDSTREDGKRPLGGATVLGHITILKQRGSPLLTLWLELNLSPESLTCYYCGNSQICQGWYMYAETSFSNVSEVDGVGSYKDYSWDEFVCSDNPQFDGVSKGLTVVELTVQ